jgi:hypothetical protein
MPSDPWRATSTSWNEIAELHLNNEVDVVKLLDKYLDFIEKCDDESLCRIAALIFKDEGDDIDSAQIAPWIVSKRTLYSNANFRHSTSLILFQSEHRCQFILCYSMQPICLVNGCILVMMTIKQR